MSESRIQDWIRYVQENAENVANGADAGSTTASTREEAAPEKIAPDAATRKLVAATLRARRAASSADEKAEIRPRDSDASRFEEARVAPVSRRRIRVETRAQLLERLTNPTITLHETSVILGVCSATVRRLTDCGELPHERTEGGQRRFRLMDVLKFQRDRREAKNVRREAKNAR